MKIRKASQNITLACIFFLLAFSGEDGLAAGNKLPIAKNYYEFVCTPEAMRLPTDAECGPSIRRTKTYGPTPKSRAAKVDAVVSIGTGVAGTKFVIGCVSNFGAGPKSKRRKAYPKIAKGWGQASEVKVYRGLYAIVSKHPNKPYTPKLDRVLWGGGSGMIYLGNEDMTDVEAVLVPANPLVAGQLSMNSNPVIDERLRKARMYSMCNPILKDFPAGTIRLPFRDEVRFLRAVSSGIVLEVCFLELLTNKKTNCKEVEYTLSSDAFDPLNIVGVYKTPLKNTLIDGHGRVAVASESLEQYCDPHGDTWYSVGLTDSQLSGAGGDAMKLIHVLCERYISLKHKAKKKYE